MNFKWLFITCPSRSPCSNCSPLYQYCTLWSRRVNCQPTWNERNRLYSIICLHRKSPRNNSKIQLTNAQNIHAQCAVKLCSIVRHSNWAADLSNCNVIYNLCFQPFVPRWVYLQFDRHAALHPNFRIYRRLCHFRISKIR